MNNALRLQVIMDMANRASAPLAAISKSSAHAAQTLKATRETLKKLNEQQRTIDGFTRQQTAMSEARNSVRVLQQNLDVLRNTQGANSKQVAAAEKALNKQTTAYDKQRDAVFQLRAKLTELGITNVTDGQTRLRTEITQTNKAIEQQTAKLKALGVLSQAGVGTAFGKVTQQLGSLAQQAMIGGAGLGYFLKRNLVDVASEFERFQTILETTEGSSAGAQHRQFAVHPGYSVRGIAHVRHRHHGYWPCVDGRGHEGQGVRLSDGQLTAVGGQSPVHTGQILLAQPHRLAHHRHRRGGLPYLQILGPHQRIFQQRAQTIQRSQALAQVTAGGMAAITRVAPLPSPHQGGGAARGQGTGQGGDTYITLNVHAAPGMDAQAVARAVSAELEKQRRREQARNRSRLSDIS